MKTSKCVSSSHGESVGVFSPPSLWFRFSKWALGMGEGVKEKFYLLILILERREFPVCETLLSRNQWECVSHKAYVTQSKV